MKTVRRSLCLLLVCALALSACGRKPVTPSAAPTAEVTPSPVPTESAPVAETPAVSTQPGAWDPDAAVALVGSPLRYAFDGQLWTGIQDFCDRDGRECWSYGGFSVDSSSSNAPLNALKAPLEDGRRVVVASSSWYLDAVRTLAGQYPDAAFLIVEPYGDWISPDPLDGNVTAVVYDQVQAGYLAGYAAVSEGCTKLGYLGFSDTAYGYGFVQGANDAAGAAGTTAEILYCYADPNATREEDRIMADLWYRSGVQVIFSSRTVDDGVIAAAEENERRVITVSGELSQLSAAVLATVGPDARQTVSQLLNAYYNGRFPGGEVLTLGCAQQGVALDIGRMAKFSQYDYEHIYGKLAAGTVVPLAPADAEGPEQLPCPHVRVDLVEGGQG